MSEVPQEQKTQLQLIEDKIAHQKKQLQLLKDFNNKPPLQEELSEEEKQGLIEKWEKEIEEQYNKQLNESEADYNKSIKELQQTNFLIKEHKNMEQTKQQYQLYVNKLDKVIEKENKRENWTDYTLQARFKTIRDFKDNVRLYLNMGQNTGMQIKSTQGRFVGVLGRFGSGKSYILNRLFEFCFPSAEDLTTEGICFHLQKELNLTLIDTQGSSEGSQAFVELNQIEKDIKQKEDDMNKIGDDPDYDSDLESESLSRQTSKQENQQEQEQKSILKKEIEDLEKRKENIEKNIKNIKRQKMNEVNAMAIYVNQLVRSVCGIIIYLVEEQNLDTEREIKSLAEFCDQNDKTLIVVMNYKKMEKIQNVQEAINKDILKSSYVDTEYSKDGKVDRYIDKSFQGKPIYRYVLAKEKSLAGMEYNTRTFDKIRDLILSSVQKVYFDYVKILYRHHYQWGPKLFSFVNGGDQVLDDKFVLKTNKDSQALTCPFQKENDEFLVYKDFEEDVEEVKIRQKYIEPKFEITNNQDNILITVLVPQIEESEEDQFYISVNRPDKKLVKSEINISSKYPKQKRSEFQTSQKVQEYNENNNNQIQYEYYKLNIVYDQGVILKKSSLSIRQSLKNGVLRVYIDKFDDSL